MKKKLLFFLTPIILLAIFYFQTKKKELTGSFARTYVSKSNLLPIDTIRLSGIVDEICLDGNNIWANQRFYITKCDRDSSKRLIIQTKEMSFEHPIVNLCVQHDSIFYLQANIKKIYFIDMAARNQRHELLFNFPVDYFTKSIGNSFLFQESDSKIASQIHYTDYSNSIQHIDSVAFSRDVGSSMRYSGNFASSTDRSTIVFVPFYDDYLFCFDAKGNLKHKIKTIDFQNQELKIIKQGARYYLSPFANALRNGGCIKGNDLFVSSFVKNRNHSNHEFNTDLIIDVYNLIDYQYRYSFTIPLLWESSPSAFLISDNNILYALYGNTILLYKYSIV